MEAYTHIAKAVQFGLDHTVGQAKFRDAVLEHTANLVQCLEHIHFEAALRHFAGKRKTRRA